MRYPLLTGEGYRLVDHGPSHQVAGRCGRQVQWLRFEPVRLRHRIQSKKILVQTNNRIPDSWREQKEDMAGGVREHDRAIQTVKGWSWLKYGFVHFF